MTRFRVVDLKQYSYCPRIIYYHHCLPHIRPTTYKMQAGLEAQADEEARAARRSLRAYGLRHGDYDTDVYLESDALELRGTIDTVIKTTDTPDGTLTLIPVDYKLTTGRLGAHFKLQLAAYALLLEAVYQNPVRRGFLYAIPRRKATEVKITPALRAKVRQAISEMKTIVDKEQMPAPVKQRSKCQVCEFRRFCNDVV